MGLLLEIFLREPPYRNCSVQGGVSDSELKAQMDIIKFGKVTLPGIAGEKTYTVKCEGCETVVSFKYSEGKYHSGQEWKEVAYLTIGCPLCHEICRVNVDRGR
jgi:phage FluMu protein Com